MLGAYAAESLKAWKRPATWVLFSIFIFLVVVFGYVLLYLLLRQAARVADPGSPNAGAAQLLTMFYPPAFVGQVLSLISTAASPIGVVLGALLAGSEYSWGTTKTVLTQRPYRPAVLAGTVLAVLVVTLVFTAAGFAAGAAASYLLALAAGEPTSFGSVLRLLRGSAAGWLIVSTWTVFGLGLALVLRSTAMAIGLGLIYALVVEATFSVFAPVSRVIQRLSETLIGSNAGSLVASFAAEQQAGATTRIPAERAVLVLLAYIVGSLLLGGLSFVRRDVA